jgi:hypothetical protein
MYYHYNRLLVDSLTEVFRMHLLSAVSLITIISMTNIALSTPSNQLKLVVETDGSHAPKLGNICLPDYAVCEYSSECCSECCDWDGVRLSLFFLLSLRFIIYIRVQGNCVEPFRVQGHATVTCRPSKFLGFELYPRFASDLTLSCRLRILG